MAERPLGTRTAMQGVRENFPEIVALRKRGYSWAEIAEVLSRLGVVSRDERPLSVVALRSAFFQVGVELGHGDRGLSGFSDDMLMPAEPKALMPAEPKAPGAPPKASDAPAGDEEPAAPAEISEGPVKLSEEVADSDGPSHQARHGVAAVVPGQAVGGNPSDDVSDAPSAAAQISPADPSAERALSSEFAGGEQSVQPAVGVPDALPPMRTVAPEAACGLRPDDPAPDGMTALAAGRDDGPPAEQEIVSVAPSDAGVPPSCPVADGVAEPAVGAVAGAETETPAIAALSDGTSPAESLPVEALPAESLPDALPPAEPASREMVAPGMADRETDSVETSGAGPALPPSSSDPPDSGLIVIGEEMVDPAEDGQPGGQGGGGETGIDDAPVFSCAPRGAPSWFDSAGSTMDRTRTEYPPPSGLAAVKTASVPDSASRRPVEPDLLAPLTPCEPAPARVATESRPVPVPNPALTAAASRVDWFQSAMDKRPAAPSAPCAAGSDRPAPAVDHDAADATASMRERAPVHGAATDEALILARMVAELGTERGTPARDPAAPSPLPASSTNLNPGETGDVASRPVAVVSLLSALTSKTVGAVTSPSEVGPSPKSKLSPDDALKWNWTLRRDDQ